MPSARLLALLGAAALIRAQEVTLPVVSPTDTALVSLPTEGPTETVTQPSFSDTVITSVPETLTLSTDVSITEPSPSATVTDELSQTVSLPWITSGGTITTTNQEGETTTATLNDPSPTTTGGGSGNWTLTTSTGTNSAGEPTTITTQITSTATTDGGEDSPTATTSEGGDAGETGEPGTGAAPRVEAAAGLGLAAVVAGLLAL